MEPYLLYEFRNEQGDIEPLVFTKPLRILQASSIEEIPAIMEEIETAMQQGYYVAGYMSYEAAPAFNPEMKVRTGNSMPLAWFGLFEEPAALGKEPEPSFYKVSGWQMESSADRYKSGIAKIKNAIEEGRTYQVNYTERLYAEFRGDARSFYRQLARNQQAGYSAYLDLGKHQILSASPELFFKVVNGKLTTKPMKGTASRGRTLAEDQEKITALLESQKEQAENLMIVDLLRNDMSRLAKRGTVRVPKLFEVETYPTVHQLTSTVEAELDSSASVFDWFKALFPCGSITGAPKISTMETIAALEQTPREVYCGAIGYFTPEKEAVFSVPIRTVVIDTEQNKARYGVGGGITWDSTTEGEYLELYAKAEVLTAQRPEFQLLESLKLENGFFPLLRYHLKRLKSSAAYFNFPGNIAEVEAQLKGLAADHPAGLYKVRLLLDKHGKATIEALETTAIKEPIMCELADSPIDSRNPFLFHKTTHRQVYAAHPKKEAGSFSVLLWNEREEITEFTIGNVVVEKDGKLFTPPVSCGLLNGTFRQKLLDNHNISEKVIHKKDLCTFDAIFFINSVRGCLNVTLT